MGQKESCCSSLKVSTCCLALKEDYELIDQIYEIDESKLVTSLFTSIIRGKLEIQQLVKCHVKYYIVLKDFQVCQNKIDLLGFIKNHVGLILQELVHIDQITIIEARQMQEYDKQSEFEKSVFVFIDPDLNTLQQDSTKGIDIFVFVTSSLDQRYGAQGIQFYLQDTPIPANVKHLTLYKKSMIFYRI